MKLLVINGPNLNLLGKREPDVYGHETLDDINNWLINQPPAKDCNIEFFQSNHEGVIIDKLHSAINNFDGILINPGAYTHYSIAIRDAISAIEVPTIEIHLSDISKREDFRKTSLVRDVCIDHIYGEGKLGYLKGVELITKYLEKKK